MQRLPVLVSELYCFAPPPSCLCATAFITFDLFPVFAATAEMEMVKLIALLEGGGRQQEVPLRIRKFSTDCQNVAAISPVAAHTPLDVCNLGAESS